MRTLALLTLAALAACTSARLPTVSSVETGAPAAVPSEGGGKVEIIGGDEAGVREFLRRWFSPGAYGAPEIDTTIWIGQLPAEPPLPLPIPDGARIIGSMQGPYTSLEVLLDVDRTFSEVREFYQEALEADGWTTPEGASMGGGFVDVPFEVDTFCLDQGDAYLTLSGRDMEGGTTDVRISLTMPAEYTPCDAQVAGQPPDLYRLLPALTSPIGAQTQSGGAGSGDGYAEASTTLRTSLSPAEVLDHYDAQLASAGWKLTSSESTETFGWSTWTVPEAEGQAWNGMLLILRVPGEDGELYALLRLTQAT
jgi:hypothetical protein